MTLGLRYRIGYDKVADDCCCSKDESKAIKGPRPVLVEDASEHSSNYSACGGNTAKHSKDKVLSQPWRISGAEKGNGIGKTHGGTNA